MSVPPDSTQGSCFTRLPTEISAFRRTCSYREKIQFSSLASFFLRKDSVLFLPAFFLTRKKYGSSLTSFFLRKGTVLFCLLFSYKKKVRCGYKLVKPKLTRRPSSTLLIAGALRVARCSLSRLLSMVRICSNNTTESLGRPCRSPSRAMWVGSFALPVRDVMAATIMVGLYLLPMSFCKISTGRIPPCSLPTTGERSA